MTDDSRTVADTPPIPSKQSEIAVLVAFDSCRSTGTSLATAHRVAALVAEELERIEAIHR